MKCLMDMSLKAPYLSMDIKKSASNENLPDMDMSPKSVCIEECLAALSILMCCNSM